MTAAFADWAFSGTWRRYQALGLDAFEADRAAGRPETLIVAPPGSGKTVVGLEIVRRLGVPALVLCPSQTIQRQWAEKQALFGPPSPDLHVLTYQALCQADDPDGLLHHAAAERWARERAEATGATAAEAAAEGEAFAGAAAQRRERELTAIVAGLKRQAAAGKLPDLAAEDLLAAPALQRLAALHAAGVATVVLDECHHLASLWGALLVPLLAKLAPAHVLGLTATSPSELSAEQAALYGQLLGAIDFTIPTPAVVREGHLAPYQELVQLCTPLGGELDWLAAQHTRFRELLVDLDGDDGPDAPPGLSAWLLARLRERRTGPGAQLSWAEFARRSPRLAESGLRWLNAQGEPPPDGAPRGEAFRAAPSLDDWVALLDDYALRCLQPDGRPAAAARLDALKAALGDLGFAVTRQGIRRAGGDVDRVLLHSAAKPLAMCEALAAEAESRGDGLRALVLTDAERPPRQPEGSPLALSGGGLGLLAAAGADDRTAVLRPAFVSAATVAVLPGDADWWCAVLAQGAPADLDPAAFVRAEGSGIVTLTHPSAAFVSRWWTARATELLAAGGCQALIGTRGLLGEGWDCPQVNVLVDMTAVAADVSVRQMRGRSLRLDPGDPEKLASNWDVICVAPALERGAADYQRFVRRHEHLHAPCEDGTIETGPSHVHPELSPFAPPAAERFAPINAEQRERADDQAGARARWRIGEPYRGVDLDAVVVRPARRARGRSGSEATGGAVAGRGGREAAGHAPPPAVPPGGLATAAAGLLVGARRHPAELPLEWAAGAVCEAYASLGELTADALASLDFGVRPEGWLRVMLPDASVEESRRVCAAIDDLLGGGALPRYVVSRPAVRPGRRWSRPAVQWHPVPADLGRNRERADAFLAAWSHRCRPSELRYCQGSDEGFALAAAASAGAAWETQRRSVWR